MAGHKIKYKMAVERYISVTINKSHFTKGIHSVPLDSSTMAVERYISVTINKSHFTMGIHSVPLDSSTS